jgi:hypothetical protein
MNKASQDAVVRTLRALREEVARVRAEKGQQ